MKVYMITVRKPTVEEKAVCESWPIWSKEISTFPWEYSDKETCLIIEGKAKVTSEDGEVAEFGPGDFVIFPKGMRCTWEILKDIKKHYMFG